MPILCDTSGSDLRTRTSFQASTNVRSKGLQRRLHLGDMASDLDLVPDLCNHAVLVDQEGGAVDAHVLAAVEALLDPGPVLRADLAVFVRDEREVEFVLGLELVVAGGALPLAAAHLRLPFFL